MQDLCIVMARGGSKRVPRKNVRLLQGKPLVSWPVRAAVASNLFQAVVISTDDEEIARAAIAAGATFPFRRPDSVSDDHSTTADALRVTLTQWKDLTGTLPDFCCCLYGTSAFITEKYLREGRALLSDAECVMAVTPYEHPIQRAMTVSPGGGLTYLQPEYVKWRTQDCPPAYHDVGLLYYFSVRAFFASGAESFLSMHLKAIIVPRTSAIDIDTEEDWILTEALAAQLGHVQ